MRRSLFRSLEIVLLVALITVTRCANLPQVFANGAIYFVDADCYARMTRARICYQHPGTIVRRHDFENFPNGTVSHTTAPFDYLIVGLATALSPLTRNALDLAGALISPLLAMAGGIFLFWWTLKVRMRFRWGLLLLYAVSPILVHGTALGRPDHQSLLIVLFAIALAAECSLAQQPTRGWGIVSGVAWALALWVSLYEPLVLLSVVLIFRALRGGLFRNASQRAGWLTFAVIMVIAALIERRVAGLSLGARARELENWAATIGELRSLRLDRMLWLEWCSGLLLLVPILFWKRRAPIFLIALFIFTFALTIWQVRWAYFFVLCFAFLVPDLLRVFRRPLIASAIFALALFPAAQFWDRTFWPNEQAQTRRADDLVEMIDLRAVAAGIRENGGGAFLAPWWQTPALAYWSRAPGVAGSSHESIGGIVESARFFAAREPEVALEILRTRQVRWVVATDPDRVAENSGQILGTPTPPEATCFVLDRHPGRSPVFLKLFAQKDRVKLYRVEFPQGNASFPEGSY